jgi:hypothetical protein
MIPGISESEARAAMSAMVAAWDSSHLPPLNCAGCRACCIGDTVKLQPGDDPARYKTKLINGRHELRKGKDGNCVYLGQAGCKIQSTKPLACRLFDCRVAYEQTMRAPDGPAKSARLATPPLVRGCAIYPREQIDV